jgi:hypothetical protein
MSFVEASRTIDRLARNGWRPISQSTREANQ